MPPGGVELPLQAAPVLQRAAPQRPGQDRHQPGQPVRPAKVGELRQAGPGAAETIPELPGPRTGEVDPGSSGQPALPLQQGGRQLPGSHLQCPQGGEGRHSTSYFDYFVNIDNVCLDGPSDNKTVAKTKIT